MTHFCVLLEKEEWSSPFNLLRLHVFCRFRSPDWFISSGVSFKGRCIIYPEVFYHAKPGCDLLCKTSSGSNHLHPPFEKPNPCEEQDWETQMMKGNIQRWREWECGREWERERERRCNLWVRVRAYTLSAALCACVCSREWECKLGYCVGCEPLSDLCLSIARGHLDEP